MRERFLSAALVLAAGAYLGLALRLRIGTLERPGPGFFPVIAGGLFLVTALAFAASRLARRDEPLPRLAPEARRRVLLTCLGFGGFCLLVPYAGYPATACLFMATMLRQLGASWRGAVVIAVLSAAGSYYVFAILLSVPLPQGLLR